MKTILFFDREDLTIFFANLTEYLRNDFRIIHVAFSKKESQMLRELGISDFIDYQTELSKVFHYNEFDSSLYKEIDQFVLLQSKGRFNLNGSIQSDRGFALLSYQEALKVAASHYTVWKNIFSNNKIDIMYHEPCSMFMTHIAALLCKGQGGIYRYPSQINSDLQGFGYINIDGETYDCIELEDKYKKASICPQNIDIDRTKRYIDKYRHDYSVFMGNAVNTNYSFCRLLYKAVRKSVINFLYRRNYDRLVSNIDYWQFCNNPSLEKIRNMLSYKYHRISFYTSLPQNEKYFYYSMHLEPEATVLYLGDGIYTNQVKLIENIAASLPAGYYLYVKDHPHEFAYRKANDYKRLMAVPNIRLISQSFSGKQLIKNCIGVLSINGTAGFEGLLLGKHVFCFGKCYYSFHKRVNYIKNIRDLKEKLYACIESKYEEDNDLYPYVYAFLTSVHKGFAAYFADCQKKFKIDNRENAALIASDIIKEFKDESFM